jgi:hypothetical protein
MTTIGKFTMLSAATIAATVALPAAAYACGEPPPEAFHTPSGNILCWMTPYSSDCQVVDHSYSVQGQSADCVSPDSPHSFSLNKGAAATLWCTDKPLSTYQDLHTDITLDYGQSKTEGAMTCVSETSGVTCTDTSSGHFFRVSRDSYELG